MGNLWFARIMGGLFVLLGLTGFFTREAFGMHFDLVHNLLHLIVGTLAVFSAMSGEEASRQFNRIAGIFFALLAAIGLVNPHFFGVLHAEESENLLHLIVAASALWFGYGHRRRTVRTG